MQSLSIAAEVVNKLFCSNRVKCIELSENRGGTKMAKRYCIFFFSVIIILYCFSIPCVLSDCYSDAITNMYNCRRDLCWILSRWEQDNMGNENEIYYLATLDFSKKIMERVRLKEQPPENVDSYVAIINHNTSYKQVIMIVSSADNGPIHYDFYGLDENKDQSPLCSITLDDYDAMSWCNTASLFNNILYYRTDNNEFMSYDMSSGKARIVSEVPLQQNRNGDLLYIKHTILSNTFELCVKGRNGEQYQILQLENETPLYKQFGAKWLDNKHLMLVRFKQHDYELSISYFDMNDGRMKPLTELCDSTVKNEVTNIHWICGNISIDPTGRYIAFPTYCEGLFETNALILVDLLTGKRYELYQEHDISQIDVDEEFSSPAICEWLS